MMHAAAGVIAGLITFAISFSLWKAVELNLAERPIEYEMLTETGSQHICDATAAQLKELEGVDVPSMFCAVRTGLKALGITPETPGAAFQLIVPFMFIVMGFRFFGAGWTAARAVMDGEPALRRLDEEEHARLNAVHAAAGGLVESPLALEPGSVRPHAVADEAEEELEPDEESANDDDDGSNGPERQS
jgi:hypothetical protein